MDVLTLAIVNLIQGLFASALMVFALPHFRNTSFIKYWCLMGMFLILNSALGILYFTSTQVPYSLVPGLSNMATIGIHIFLYASLLSFFGQKISKPFMLLSLGLSFAIVFTPFAEASVANRLILYFPIIMLFNGLSLLLLGKKIQQAKELKPALHAFAITLTFNLVQIGLRFVLLILEKFNISLPLSSNVLNGIGFFGLTIFSMMVFSSCLFLLYKLKQLDIIQAMERDPLTGILNRHAMDSKLQQALSLCIRQNNNCSIVLFDIDNFKNINDTYGHLVGDKVIRHIAQQASKSLRPYDLLFRFGGEEFLLCLPDTNKEDAMLVSERLRKSIEQTNPARYPNINVTISLGLVTVAEKTDINDLLGQADAALYQAKQTGRNKTVIAIN